MDKYIVKVNNKKHVVEFDESVDVNQIKEVYLDGKKVTIDVNMDTLCSIVVDNNTHKINGIYDFDGEPVKLLIGKDYHNIEIEEFRPVKLKTKKDNTHKKQAMIKAPMPGKITSIDVNIGDLVEIGQPLLALEAMKMENRIKSPKKGGVKEIKAVMGATCNSGDLLMIIE